MGTILAWTDGDVTGETGQTTTIYIYAEDGVTLLNTIPGLTGTSYDIPLAAFMNEPIALVRVGASRTDADGTFDSLQAHGIWVKVATIVPAGLSASGAGAFSPVGDSITGPTFYLGDNTSTGSNVTYTPNFWEGLIYQAVADGTLNYLYIKGETGGDHFVNYRLVIYEATSATDTAGPKLGETAVVSSLLANEEKQIPLLAPVSIINGQFYAVGIQKDGSMNSARRAGTGGRLFFDTFSDGALGTAPTGGNNGPAPSIWGSD